MHSAADGDDELVAPGSRWAVTGRAERAVLTAAGVALVLAAALALLAARSAPRTVVTTRTLAATGQAPTLDATGCPVDRTCTVVPGAAGAALAAVRQDYPDTRLLSATRTADTATGTVYRAALLFRLGDNSTLSVWAQNVPGTAAVRDGTDRNLRVRPGLGGDNIVDARLTTVRHGCGDGCSTAVQVVQAGLTRIDETTLTALAHDRRILIGR